MSERVLVRLLSRRGLADHRAWLVRSPAATECPVLVAEDDPCNRALIASALRRRRLMLVFKPFDIVQLLAYVKASCELPHYDRRRSRIVTAAQD